jgi:hypothetical protein
VQPGAAGDRTADVSGDDSSDADPTDTPGSAGLGADGPGTASAGLRGTESAPGGAGLGPSGAGWTPTPAPTADPPSAPTAIPGGAGLGGSSSLPSGGLGAPPGRAVGPGGLLPGWDVPAHATPEPSDAAATDGDDVDREDREDGETR